MRSALLAAAMLIAGTSNAAAAQDIKPHILQQEVASNCPSCGVSAPAVFQQYDGDVSDLFGIRLMVDASYYWTGIVSNNSGIPSGQSFHYDLSAVHDLLIGGQTYQVASSASHAFTIGALFTDFYSGGAAYFDVVDWTPFLGDGQIEGLASTSARSIDFDWPADYRFDPMDSEIRMNVRLLYLISSIPEPSTWLMMITGFGLVGGAIRRQRTIMTAG